VFERYTEKARRSIFFARYEASQVGATEIEIEHFLLGVLREDRVWAGRVPVEEIRKRILQHFPAKPKISLSVDLPLSHAMKRVLAYGAEEAERFGHGWIDTRHHLLGILREPSFAADRLREYGLNEEALRAGMRPAPHPKAVLLKPAVHGLDELVQSREQMPQLSEAQVARGFDETRKVALGHLVDCAIGLHQWLARGDRNAAFEFPAQGLLAEEYKMYAWRPLVELWLAINDLLIHILCQIPEFEAEPVAAAAMAYVQHCGEVIKPFL